MRRRQVNADLACRRPANLGAVLRPMVFKSVRNSSSDTAATCMYSVRACWVVQDHPAYIPRSSSGGTGETDRQPSAVSLQLKPGMGWQDADSLASMAVWDELKVMLARLR